MRAKLYYSFLVLLVGSLYFTACDTTSSQVDNFEESIQLYTDLEPVQGASNVTAVINKGENARANFGSAAGSDSWFQVKLQNIQKNDIINNGTAGAWCLEWKKPLRSDNDIHEGTRFYSTKGAKKWQPMHYFFSIKNELKREDPTLTVREFQSVVWSLAGYIGIAPEFDLNTVAESELPRRLFVDGQMAVDKNKVAAIVNRVKSEYKAKSTSSLNSFAPTVMETEGDEQDVIIPDPPPVIEVDTNIYIYFDASGSMNSTLFPLETMRDTELKNALLPLYDNDSDAYDSRVQVISWCGINCERTFSVANLEGAAPPAEGNVVVLIFQDEAQSTYHPFSNTFDPTATRTVNYDTDITALRTRLDNFISDPEKGSNYYRSVIFQVDGFFAFKSFVESVQNGTGNYAVPWGLSDRSEFNYVYDVLDGDSPENYRDLIIDALEDLGFDLTP